MALQYIGFFSPLLEVTYHYNIGATQLQLIATLIELGAWALTILILL